MTGPAYRICLWAVVGLGAFLRLSTLGLDSAWVDEVLSISYSSGSLLDVLDQLESQHMPLYFLITSVMLQINDGEVWLRLPSAAFGIATLPLLYRIGVEAGRPRVGLAAAGLAAVSPFLVSYSQEIRMYSLVAFLGVLGTWGVVCCGHPDAHSRRRGWIVLAVASILNLYSSPFAAFIVASHWAVVAAFALRRRELCRLLVCGGLVAAAYVPGILHMLPMITGSADVVQAPQRQYDDLSGLVGSTAGHFAGLVIGLRRPLLAAAGLGALVGLFAARYRSPSLVVIAVLSFAVPIATLHVVKPHHFFNPRYLIFAQPHLLLMVAIALVFVWDHAFGWTQQWRGSWASVAAIGPVATGVVGLLVATFLDPDREISGRKGDWRGVARVLRDDLQSGDLVMIEPPWRDGALLYALDREAGPDKLMRPDAQSGDSAYRALRRAELEERHPEQYGGPQFELLGFDGIPEFITVARDKPGRIWVIASGRSRELRVLGFQPVYTMPAIHSYSGGRTASEAMPILFLRGR